MLSHDWCPSHVSSVASTFSYSLRRFISLVQCSDGSLDSSIDILWAFKKLEDKFVELQSCVDYIDDCVHLDDEDVA
uniref:Uncharacterized protein n=1 Tax=Johanseniella sp. A1345 TaxID=380087 RepID=A3F821_9NOST|nr:hypothetical protein [Johanseniella A1345]